MNNKNDKLQRILSSIDISPSDFERARKRYNAVSSWLADGDYKSGNRVNIYLQGSFRLGTVIRPYRNSKDSDYDIDQVCEIIGNAPSAFTLKHDVGDRLKENADYKRMLDEEGRRCWTLEYASAEDRPGFHLDVLPSRPRNQGSTFINITEKSEEKSYSWRSSNPKGYYRWFKERNRFDEAFLSEQRAMIFSSNSDLYRSALEVPKQLVRTPLQRSIQLMKRHRDVYFDGKKGAPISIIITTICTHKYENRDILTTANSFADYVLNRLAIVVKGDPLPVDHILDFQNGKWDIPNPADAYENFADRWEKKPELAENFFSWVFKLKRDLKAFADSNSTRDLHLAVSTPEDDESPYGSRLVSLLSDGPVESDDDFLNLIHQGIDGQVKWPDVKRIAERNVDQASSENSSKDIAWINFYQVKLHSSEGLSSEDKQHIRGILTRRISDPAFVYCCNLLLGSANRAMLRECIADRGHDVIQWPIVRLPKAS